MPKKTMKPGSFVKKVCNQMTRLRKMLWRRSKHDRTIMQIIPISGWYAIYWTGGPGEPAPGKECVVKQPLMALALVVRTNCEFPLVMGIDSSGRLCNDRPNFLDYVHETNLDRWGS